MKKLMFAAALAAGLAAMAEVTSGNVVGYMNKDTTEGGMTLQTPVFTTIGNGSGVYLSEIAPAGYEENEDFLEDDNGTDGEFAVQTLTAAGKAGRIFGWKRSVSEGKWLNDGRWLEGGTPVTGVNEFYIQPGVGLWCQCPDYAGDDDADYALKFQYPED